MADQFGVSHAVGYTGFSELIEKAHLKEYFDPTTTIFFNQIWFKVTSSLLIK